MHTVWPALIAAVAALSGVVVGQAFQSVRDRKAHDRELAREDARRRYESSVRFMDARLETFAELLSTLNVYWDMKRDIWAARETMKLSVDQPLPVDTAEPIRKQLVDWSRQCDALVFRLRLLASKEVADLAYGTYLDGAIDLEDHLLKVNVVYAFDNAQDELGAALRNEITSSPTA